jgi:hypothetical protein
MAADAPADTDIDYRGLLEAERADLRAQLAALGLGPALGRSGKPSSQEPVARCRS